MAWTDERVEQLKTLWTGGASASQIAKELGGVTRNAVIGKVHRLGLSSRNQGKPEAAEKPAKPAPVAPPPVAEAAPAPEPTVAAAPPTAAPVSPVQEVKSAPQPVEAKDAGASDAALPAAVTAPEGMITIPSENQVDIAEIDRDARKLGLMDLTERTCKWPVGDPATEEFWFCGLPVKQGKPYCEAHVGVAFQPMSARRDRRR